MVATFLHPTAVVDEGAVLGEGCRVWHFTHISAHARIGAGCSFGQNVFVGNDVLIGNNVKVQNNVSIYDAVTLEDDVFCGPSMVFTNVYNPRSAVVRKTEYRKTLVKKGATLGANCTVVCGVIIGQYAFVGAGAVVNRTLAELCVGRRRTCPSDRLDEQIRPQIGSAAERRWTRTMCRDR